MSLQETNSPNTQQKLRVGAKSTTNTKLKEFIAVYIRLMTGHSLPSNAGLQEWHDGENCDDFFLLTQKQDYQREKVTKRRLYWRKGIYKTQVA